MREQLDNTMQLFDPIGLDEMDNVQLMSRVDTKFVLSMDQLLKILPELASEYRMLEIDGSRFPLYESEYYDDKDLSFYTDHHRKKVDRFKVRFRKYVDSDLSFLEVKHKNKGRTDKSRIRVADLPGEMSGEHEDFLRSTGIKNEDLKHVLTNKFNRITLVAKHHNERLTLDLNLQFNSGDKISKLSNLVIAELKQERMKRNSPFFQKMKDLLIRPYRLSKYCIGIIELYGKDNVKYNRFKKKLLKIKKLRTNVA